MDNATQTKKAVIAVLAVVLVGILSFIAWQAFAREDDSRDITTSEVTPLADETLEENTQDENDEMPAEEGIITGSLTYPSEGIPPSLQVHAYNIDTLQDFFIKDQINDSRFRYGVGFEMTVPAGRYYVYSTMPEMPGYKAYYNEFVRCGMSVECTDRTNIEVIVEPGETTESIMVGDWYNN